VVFSLLVVWVGGGVVLHHQRETAIERTKTASFRNWLRLSSHAYIYIIGTQGKKLPVKPHPEKVAKYLQNITFF
jgi:hypothetical protein